MNESAKKIKEGFIGQRMIVLPPDVRRKVEVNPLIRDIHLTAIGFYPNASHHDRERKQGSEEYILLYCIEGEGIVIIEDQEFQLKPNTYIIIPPFSPHHYKSSIPNPWSICWVHFTGGHSPILYSKYLNNDQRKIKLIPYNEDRLSIFFQVIDILEDSFSVRHLESTNIKLLYFLTSLIYYSEINPSSYEKDSVSASIDFMKKNLGKNLKIEALAKQQNLSVSRFSEIFKEKTGFSPIKYFIQLKIQKSCQFLYFTDMSIKEICLEVGFVDPYYFSRMFKKLMGMPPTTYKKNYKK